MKSELQSCHYQCLWSRVLQEMLCACIFIITTGLSDEEQLILSHTQNRVFYTFNVGDFCQLHSQFLAENRNHAGIIISTQDYSVGEQMRRILKLIADRSAESMVNELVFLSSYAAEV